MSVSVLAHNQALGTPASTRVTADVAEELVRRLVCERITRKLIRMFPPASVFLAKRAQAPIANYSLEHLPPREVVWGCVFRGPRCLKPHSIFFRHPAREARLNTRASLDLAIGSNTAALGDASSR